MSIVVAKFGGTSLADHEAMQNCVRIVKAHRKPVVTVLSAPSGITNQLVLLGQRNISDDKKREALAAIHTKVLHIANTCSNSSQITTGINQLYRTLECTVLEADSEPSAGFKDKILAFGERFSTAIFTHLLRESGSEAINFDVCRVMKTDDSHGQAQPLVEQLKVLANSELLPLVHDRYVITQGFLGSTLDGQPTTLGRGGSDYSAALLSEALNAERCEIWTDVAGVYSTDPRIVAQAFPLYELSYDEASEMANFGAKVLHPATLAPTLRQNIPVFVGSSREPENGGTLIVKDCKEEPPFRAITRRREQDLVTLHSPKLLRSHQFIGQVFRVLEQLGISIDLITTSETSISLTFNDQANVVQSELKQKALVALGDIANVEVEEQLDLITLVGNHLHETKGAYSRVFAALEPFAIRMICYGANPHNISFLLHKEDSDKAINTLHKTLFKRR